MNRFFKLIALLFQKPCPLSAKAALQSCDFSTNLRRSLAIPARTQLAYSKSVTGDSVIKFCQRRPIRIHQPRFVRSRKCQMYLALAYAEHQRELLAEFKSSVLIFIPPLHSLLVFN